MKRDVRTLDANLARLLSRAYVPVRPSAAFRSELEARLGASVARHARPRALRAPPGRLPRLAAAAALLLFPLLVFLATRMVARVDDLLADPDGILADGRAALCEDERGWRAVTDDELASGVALGELRSLELRTPRDVVLVLRAGGAAGADGVRLAAHGETVVRLAREPDASGASGASDVPAASGATGAPGRLGVRLERGELLAEASPGAARAATGGPGPVRGFRLDTPGGSLTHERGSLRAIVVGREAALFLSAGAARGPAGEPLPLATWLVLRDGALVDDGHAPAPPAAALAGPLDPHDGTRVAAAPPDGASPAATSGDPSDVSADEPAVDEDPPAAGTARLTGNVRAPDFAAPATSFHVVLLRQVPLPAVAEPRDYAFGPERSPAGAFAILDLRPGTYTVFVVADGFATWKRRNVVLAASGEQHLVVELASGATVAGRVVDARGRPVEGAFVLSEHAAPTQVLPLELTEHGRAAGAVVTDHEGRFELPRLAAGPHVLRASARGHGAVWSALLTLEPGTRTDEVTLELGPEAVLHGRVARDDGTPWKDAYVVASLIDYTFQHPCMTGDHGLTDADGAFEIRGLPEGSYVVFNASEIGPGGSPRIRSVPLAEGARVRVDLPGDAHGTRLAGSLRDADGTPLGSLDLTLIPVADERTFFTARTDSDGSYTFLNLAPGTYAGYVSREMGTDMTLLGTVDVPRVPELEHDFRIGSAAIAGHVSANGAPLGNAVVILQRIDRGAPVSFAGKDVTGADGRYEFSGIEPGEYDVSAFATAGRLGEEHVESLVLYEDQRLEAPPLELLPGGALIVRVADDAGRPVERAEVEFLDPRGRSVTFDLERRTDTTGELSVAGMKPGTWTVSAHVGSARVEARIEIRADTLSVLPLILTR